jgi:ATP-dependent Lhr-like helicase
MRGAEMLDSLVRQENHPLMRERGANVWRITGPAGGRAANKRHPGRDGPRPEMQLEIPSPMSFLLRRQTEAAMMYDYSPTPWSHCRRRGGFEARVDAGPRPEHLALSHARTKSPENDNQLHSLLMIEGDLTADDRYCYQYDRLRCRWSAHRRRVQGRRAPNGVLYEWLETLGAP